ncbi:MAG: T9SS type A sorting domain-containing protein [Saprospiraceae bacterium]|nr:T9SS type A sorting domain-containing protein [Saprospiraceae bacterium]
MKNALFFLLLLLPGYAGAQNYQPMLEPDREWVVGTWYAYEQCLFVFPPWSDCTSRERFVLEGDTVIQGETYYKCLRQEFSLASGWQGPFTLGSKQYLGAVREDLVAKKVYAWAPALQTDVLLHDFSLGIGDTAVVCLDPFTEATTFYPLVADSVFTLPDGRTKWFVNTSLELVEGVGMNSGLFPTYPCFEVCIGMVCLKDNGVAVLDDENWPFQFNITTPVCSYTIVSQNNPVGEQMKVWPNPTNGQVFLEGFSGKDVSLVVFNAMGQSMDTPFAGGRLDLTGLPPGLYFLRMNNGILGWATVVKL